LHWGWLASRLEKTPLQYSSSIVEIEPVSRSLAVLVSGEALVGDNEVASVERPD
jgi:glucose-6-phosphate dehydrogenase assembly protein OpcA